MPNYLQLNKWTRHVFSHEDNFLEKEADIF